MMQARQHWAELDGMRGILSLGVVLLHFGFNSMASRVLGWNGIRFELAVDVFFLLSGYVLAHSARNGVVPMQFVIKRFWRLAPVFYATTIVAALASRDEVSPMELFMAVPLVGSDPINFPAWSISWEFYLPVLAILIPLRIPGKFIAPLLAICLTGLAITSVGVAMDERLYLIRAILGLSGGFLLYRANLPLRGPVMPVFAATFAVLAVAAYIPLIAVLLPPLACIAIVSGRESKTVLSSAPIQFLGTLSYTLYLAHIPILLIMQRIWGTAIDGNPLAKIGGLAATFVFAGLLTVLVEKPLMQRRSMPPASTAP